MSHEITVTVNAWNGEKELTLDAYVKQWTEQVRDLVHLSSSSEEYEDVCEMQRKIKDMAVNRFFELYKLQK